MQKRKSKQSSIRRNRPSPNCPARTALLDYLTRTRRASRQPDTTDFGDRQPFQFQGTAVKLALAPFITPLLPRVCRWHQTATHPDSSGFSSRLSTRAQRAMVCLWRITPRKSRHAFFLRFSLSLSLFVATSFETRSTCKPSAIGRRGQPQKSHFKYAFLLRSYYATRFEPPATRSFFFFTLRLSYLARPSSLHLSLWLFFSATFFCLIIFNLSSFSLYVVRDTNDGNEGTFSSRDYCSCCCNRIKPNFFQRCYRFLFANFDSEY